MEKCTTDRRDAIDTPIREFIIYLTALKYSPHTIQSYKNTLKKFHLFLTAHSIVRVQDVTLQDLERFRLALVDEGFARKSLQTYLINIRQFYNYLENTLQIFTNPSKKEVWIIPKSRSRLQHVPSETDMKTLLETPDTNTTVGIRDRALLETMYSTGIRLEETVRLDVIDVDLKQKILKVLGKGDKERMVPLGKQAIAWLDTYLKTVRPVLIKKNPIEAALFVGPLYGRRINSQILALMVRDYSIQAGVTLMSPHAIRRACATHLLRGGAHPVQIQELLGHATMKSLNRYLQVTMVDLKNMYAKGNPGK